MANVADLLGELVRVRIARPADLFSALRISPPTLSRLVAAAGEQVCRIGRARAVRYARTRAIEGLGRRLPVFRVSETGEATAFGTLHLLWEGQHWWERPDGGGVFTGLPPALADMAPQGYLGHGFPARFPELGLPPRVTDWADDHRLVALARRGEDCVGDLIVGNESFSRFVAWEPEPADREDYPQWAERSAVEAPGSSAGGERPKFGVFSRGRHVLVKFAPPATSGAARRWQDLLWCEWKALEVVAAAGVAAARAECVDVRGWRFLEVDRFDRIAERGRRAVLTLGAIDDEHFGKRDTWTAAAARLRGRPSSLSGRDASHLRWLDAFGQLIGNTDRHFGNIAFFAQPDGALRLAPAYDMLPMVLAPAGETVVARPFEPSPPNGDNIDVWSDAAAWAERYWRAIAVNEELEADVREFARAAAAAVVALARRVAPERPQLAPVPGATRRSGSNGA
jgi:HipA-like protein